MRAERRRYFFRGLLFGVVPTALIRLPQAWGVTFPAPVAALLFVVALASTVIGVFQTIKRLHDVDHTGWLWLVFVIPLINFVFGIYLLFRKGTDGPNRFGPDPLAG